VPAAIPVVGAERVATSVAVAAAFFDAPTVVGIATAGAFPDALAGGAAVARDSGPVLLSAADRLSDPVAGYLGALGPGTTLLLFGGPEALSPQVEASARAALDDDRQR